MTRPIPSWDIVNRLVRYLAKKQLANDPATLKQASWRVGLGSKQILKMLEENGVKFHLTYLKKKRTTKNTIIRLQSIPDRLSFDIGLSREQIEENFKIFVAGEAVRILMKKNEQVEKERFFIAS